MNVTLPLPLIVNVPFPSSVTESVGWLFVGSTNLRLVIDALVTPSGIVNVGVSDCGTPWISLVVLSPGVTSIGVTVGLYVASFVSPFSSVACTVIPVAGPLNSGFGMNITWPVVLSILYVPSFGTSISALSTGVLVTGSTSLYPEIWTLGSDTLNSGVPVCVLPCGASEVLSLLSIVTSVTVGV